VGEASSFPAEREARVPESRPETREHEFRDRFAALRNDGGNN
jgi:hypothetical protein